MTHHPHKVDASECMIAVGNFTAAVIELEENTRRGTVMRQSPELETVYAALTKAEKVCGHVKAHDVRSALDSVRNQDDPDLLTEADVEFHDYMTTVLVLDFAREMKERM